MGVPKSPAETLRRIWALPRGKLGLSVAGPLVLLATLGPLAVAYPPNESDFQAGLSSAGLPVGISRAHWLGCDHLFRDELSRLAEGARYSLGIAGSAVLLALTIGTAVGTLAGLCHGGKYRWVDQGLMRLVDLILSFPYLLLVMAIGAALERSTPLTISLILGGTGWLGTARLLRAKTLQIRSEGYVEAAHALGQSPWQIFRKHIFPSYRSTLVVIGTTAMAGMILSESVLSYLQVGLDPPTATWGRMLQEGQGSFRILPRLVLAPGFCIVLAVLGFHLLGDALDQALGAKAKAKQS